jgi:hypothetical protein
VEYFPQQENQRPKGLGPGFTGDPDRAAIPRTGAGPGFGVLFIRPNQPDNPASKPQIETGKGNASKPDQYTDE